MYMCILHICIFTKVGQYNGNTTDTVYIIKYEKEWERMVRKHRTEAEINLGD
jgi:hypothetical protein